MNTKEEIRIDYYKRIKEIEDKEAKIAVGNKDKILKEIPLKAFCILWRKAASIYFDAKKYNLFLRKTANRVCALVHRDVTLIYISEEQLALLEYLQIRHTRLHIPHK